MNIFRQAKQLLDTKSGPEMTEEELQLVATATIPLMVRTNGIFPEDITIVEGLEELANMVNGKESKMKIKDSIWFTNMKGVVGVILGEDEVTGKHKAYIGIADGQNQKGDEELVARRGNKLNYETAARITHWLKENRKSRGRAVVSSGGP